MTRRLLLIALLTLAFPTAALADGSGRMAKASYGKRWPLTVTSGTVHCSNIAITFTAGGTTYAVNGIALSRFPHMPQIARIWKRDPNNLLPNARIDLGPIIDRGLKLCGI